MDIPTIEALPVSGGNTQRNVGAGTARRTTFTEPLMAIDGCTVTRARALTSRPATSSLALFQFTRF